MKQLRLYELEKLKKEPVENERIKYVLLDKKAEDAVDASIKAGGIIPFDLTHHRKFRREDHRR